MTTELFFFIAILVYFSFHFEWIIGGKPSSVRNSVTDIVLGLLWPLTIFLQLALWTADFIKFLTRRG